jgi:hypothetical protein
LQNLYMTIVMKKLALTLAASVSLIATSDAQFTPGTLAVMRMGGGTETLGTAGNTISILDYGLTGGSPLFSVTIPNSILVGSGTSGSEGALSLSANGNYLTVAGYKGVTLPYAGSLPNVAASVVNRGVAQLDLAGNVTSAAFTANRLNGNGTTPGNPRTAVTDGSGNYWIGGSASAGTSAGVFLLTQPTTTTIFNTSGPRTLNFFNGNLYFTTSAGIQAFSGAPTASATPTSLFTVTGNGSPQDFAINPAGNVAYIADATAATGGIQKWTLSGSTWSLAYTLGAGKGIFGLAADFANGKLYGTTADVTFGNSLVEIDDLGLGSTSASDNILATAASNEVFKGLDFTPGVVPEPSTFGLLGLGLLLFGNRLRRTR